MARVAATVVEVRDGRAWIECSDGAPAGCSACGTGRGCGWRPLPDKQRWETAARLADRTLQPGDTVELEAD
jgi:positive regulator of sigma E activity